MSSGLFLERNDRVMLIVIAITIFVLVSDTMINQVSDYLAPQLVSGFGISLFTFFVIVFGISQYLILKYIKEKIGYMISNTKSTEILHKMVLSIQFLLLILLSFLVGQVLISSSYSTYLLTIITILNYFLNVSLMAYFPFEPKFLTHVKEIVFCNYRTYTHSINLLHCSYSSTVKIDHY